jgi:hypothetical protein
VGSWEEGLFFSKDFTVLPSLRAVGSWEEVLLFSMDFTVFPILRAVGSWEEVLLFSMDFTVSQNYLELEVQDANFCLKKLAFALTEDSREP